MQFGGHANQKVRLRGKDQSPWIAAKSSRRHHDQRHHGESNENSNGESGKTMLLATAALPLRRRDFVYTLPPNQIAPD